MMVVRKLMLAYFLGVIFSLCLIQSLQATYGFMPFMEFASKQEVSPEQNKSILPFFSGIEAKKKERKVLDDDISTLKKRADEVKKTLTDTLSQITYELTQAKDVTEKSEADKSEQVNKKITFLNDRKQNLSAYQDLFKVIEDVLVARTAKIDEHINFLQHKQNLVLKSLYSWQEFRDQQAEISRLNGKLDELRAKKESFIKQDLTEKETISSLQKQIEFKTKERDKTITDSKSNEKVEHQHLSLKLETDVFNEEINLSKEKVTTLQLKLEHLIADLKLKEDEIDFVSSQLSSHKSDLAIMEKRLDIELIDVENARNEAASERQKAIIIKEEVNQKIETKNIERSRLEVRKEKLIKDRKKIEDLDNKRDSAKFREAKSEEQKILCNFESTVQSIKVLQIKGERADTEADEKDLLYKMVDLRHKLTQNKGDLKDSLAQFKSLRDLVLAALRKWNLDRQDVMNSLVNDTKELEKLHLCHEEIVSSKDSLFLNNNIAYQFVLKNIDITEKLLHEHMKMCHNLLVDNSELISSKDKIVDKYNLIIQDIETMILNQGIWKRSPNAISWEGFQTSLFEAENFLGKFFWDTPIHLGPSALIASCKLISWKMVLYACLFFIFFTLSFLCIKFLLGILLRRIRRQLSVDHHHFSFLWLNISSSLLEFLVDHLKLIFTLIFLYVHIVFGFRYIFSTIYFIATPYNLVLFYLISIPSFVYLSKNLLSNIKDLNKRLSFLFFAEKLEERFILLITFFCYSTAIIIPFRQAFLGYHPHPHFVFPHVLLTAYSLVLAIIWLLFFSKDVVLRIIPFRGRAADLIRIGIEQHYYPVFFFCMGLLILPLIGYSNLAWFLAFAIPSTVLLFYAVLMVHYYIRKYALFLFMKEEDEEIVDKFEYAKTYYGLLVIFSFLVLLFSAFAIAAHLWRFGYTPAGIWTLLADHWVIKMGSNPMGGYYKFGVIQFLILVLFVVCGFFVSSFTQRFILNKLFDILRTEPGMQNTVSKILHYATISLSGLLGLSYVHLDQLLVYVGAVSAVAIGFVLKDVAADYIAGLFILIERPLEIGNYVRLDQDEQKQGTVHKIDARTTTIINKFNHALIIPNKDITNKLVSNWGKGRFAVGIEITVNVDYHSDVALVRETIAEVVQSNPTILRVPRIIIRMEDFNDTRISFLVRVFISSRRVREGFDIAADLRENMFRTFREKGIEFAYPQNVIHLARDVYPNEKYKNQDPISFKF